MLCTDAGLSRRHAAGDLATWLTSAPILNTAPKMMDQAEKRAGPDGDNLSAIVVRWGPELTDDAQSTVTDTLGLGEFATEIDRTMTLKQRREEPQRDLTDDEIERAIAEIQSTIQKYRK